MAQLRIDDSARVFLVYGNNEVEVNNTRYELVNHFLTPEERDAGLAEIRGPGNQALTLARALNEIIEELGTSSFIAGARRVVVVYDLAEFYEAKRAAKPKAAATTAAAPAKKKKVAEEPEISREQALISWFEKFRDGENIAIFVCNENDEKKKEVNQDSDLYRYVSSRGAVIERREKKLNYEWENHLFDGNTTVAISMLREWIDRASGDSGTRGRILGTLGNTIELALQAKCVGEAKERGIPEAQVLPNVGWPSLAKTPSFKLKKIQDLARRHSMESLHGLVRRINKLQAIMYPTGEEPYILDWEEYMEVTVIELCMGTARR